MPIVTVQMASGRDTHVKRKLADEITKLMVDTLQVE